MKPKKTKTFEGEVLLSHRRRLLDLVISHRQSRQTDRQTDGRTDGQQLDGDDAVRRRGAVVAPSNELTNRKVAVLDRVPPVSCSSSESATLPVAAVDGGRTDGARARRSGGTSCR